MQQHELGCLRPEAGQHQRVRGGSSAKETQPATAKGNSDRGNVKKRSRRRRAGGLQPFSKSMIGPPINSQQVNRLDRDAGPPDHRLAARLGSPRLQVDQEQIPETLNDSVVCHSGEEAARVERRRPARDRPGHVRTGIIGTPTNFQHVAHARFSASVMPQVSDGRRQRDPSRATSSSQGQTSDPKTGNFSCKSLDVEGGEEPLWESQDWYLPDGDDGQWEDQEWYLPDGDSQWGPQCCSSSDDGQQEDHRRTITHSPNLSRPLPLTLDDSDQPLHPSAARRKGMVGPPSNFQHVNRNTDRELRVVKECTRDEEEVCDARPLQDFRRNVPGGVGSQHRSKWKTHRWSSPIGDLDLQEAQLGSQRWPSLGGDGGQQLVKEAAVSRRHLKTRGSSLKLQRRGSLEAGRQEERANRRAAGSCSRPTALRPPGGVRVMPGPPTDLRATRVGFTEDTAWQASQAQEPRHPAREVDVDERQMFDGGNQEEAQWQNHRWPGPDGGNQEEAQWQNHRWPGPDGGNQEEAQWKKHPLPRPHTMNDPTRPLSPPPGVLRKDSIGPPTNFQHILHVDRDSTVHELQQLMANLNKQGAPHLKTHKSLPDLVDRWRSQRAATGLACPPAAPPPLPTAAAGIRKDMIGPPTNFQHVSHVGFGDKRTVEEQQDLSGATSWDERPLPETQGCVSDHLEEGGGLQTQPWSSRDGDCGQQVQGEGQQWASTSGGDGGQQEQGDPGTPLGQAPFWLRKDMIGPPTNFQHVLHLDPDDVDQEVHQLLREAGMDQQPLAEPEPESRRFLHDFTERLEEAGGRPSSRRNMEDPAHPGRVRKNMIGSPTNFQHVAHVGFSSSISLPVSEEQSPAGPPTTGRWT